MLAVKLAVPQTVNLTRAENGESVTATTTRYYIFYEQTLPVTVIDSALSLTLSLNGAATGKPLNFGDALNYVIHYKNSSDATLRNIVILATVDSPFIDWSKLSDPRSGERIDNAVLWTKAEVADLASLAPGAEGSFGFSLQLKDTGEAQNSAEAEAVRAALTYSIDSALPKDGVPAVELKSPLNTEISFGAQLRYFDQNNNAVGAGPLPPKAGERTAYRAYLRVVAGRHDITNVTVTSTLPVNAEWTGDVSQNSGNVSYNAAAREIIWHLPGLDSAGEPALLQFTVNLTPAVSDRNKIVTVLNQANLIATDAVTNGAVTATAKPKTTALEDDAAGQGKGVVE